MIPQFQQFNAYSNGGTGAPPFKFNNTYDLNQSNEANTYNNIYSEFTYLYGSDIIFLPREVSKEETTFGEFLAATIQKGYPIRLFIEEVQAWGGNGDMYTKFGLQVTDECTLYCNKLTFTQATGHTVPIGEAIPGETPIGGMVQVFPKQGDLVYIVKSQKLFQVSHVEDEISPSFYLLGNRSGYKIQCKLFTYTHEQISQENNTGIPEAVKALDSLLRNINTPNASAETLENKEFINNNKPIQTVATSIVDTTEFDPLG